jgi:hypothetical protein
MGQRCIVCWLNRQLIGTEPVTKQYEIQSLECPRCKSVVRLVQRRAVPLNFQHRISVRRAAHLYSGGERREVALSGTHGELGGLG